MTGRAATTSRRIGGCLMASAIAEAFACLLALGQVSSGLPAMFFAVLWFGGMLTGAPGVIAWMEGT